MDAENALCANIKQKGENSYYAHQPQSTATAQVLAGVGLITGGDPNLLMSTMT